MVAYLILALLIAILAVIFALQNITAVTISFFAWEVSGSLSLILLLALALGFLIGVLVMLPTVIKHKVQVSNQRKQKNKLEKELNALKARLDALQPAEKTPPPIQSEAVAAPPADAPPLSPPEPPVSDAAAPADTDTPAEMS